MAVRPPPRGKEYTAMQVEFRRIGARRYAVTVRREDGSVLEMDPAAGFDPLIPHDLAHLVVESELGLRRGIFGQIAAGGTAGTFRTRPQVDAGRREAARRRRRQAHRGEALLREGRRDSQASEEAVAACMAAWAARRAARGPGAAEGPRAPEGGERPRSAPPPAGIAAERLDAICDRFDRLSGEWSGLAVGESLVVRWPLRDPDARHGKALPAREDGPPGSGG